VALSRDHHGPRAVLNALDRLASADGSEVAGNRQELTIAESQLRDYQAQMLSLRRQSRIRSPSLE